MLSRIGNSADGDDARSTLEQMRELANERALTLIHLAEPRRTEPRARRNVYDAQGGRDLPGKLILSDHRTTGGDLDARQAYEGAGTTMEFFHRVYGRNSLDGGGFPLNATVHYGTRFQNAMWTGDQIVYGDGDARFFNSFTVSIDITAHELTHGIVQFTTGMGYSGEAGAVNESMADVFGSLVKQFQLQQTAEQADWLIGAELLRPCVKGRGVRSLAAPGHAYDDPVLGRDPQPSHMRDYVETDEDHGGVHINSGIPNHAFYLAAMAIGGPSWEVAGRIWYRTLVEGLPNEPTFFDLALNTVDMAGELYGYGSRYQRIVADAWARVGIVVPLDDDRTIPPFPLGAQPRARWRERLPR
ncbi:MAG TPA: M4 family metallopeptidase [Thermoanaerobaculia bacterium]|jgi:Zn-dependent metalloprotease